VVGTFTVLKNKKHLLFITPGFPDGEEDSRCIPALQVFAKALLEKGIRISVISLHYPYSPKNYKWFEVDVYGLGGDNKKGLKRFSVWRKAIRVAKQIHKKESISHIQSFWLGECTWLGNKIADKFQLSHSCTLMGQDVLKPNSWVKRIKKLPPLIALSDFHQEKLQESFGISAEQIIPWGVEESQALKSSAREIDILGVGNFNELKNYRRFLQIVKRLSSKVPQLNVCLIGDGEERSNLEKNIRDLDLQNVVQICGFLERDEVLRKMKQSKLLLHCATFESFGMVVIEALNLGVKVFSTPVGIAAELESVSKVEEDEVTAKEIAEFMQQDKFEQEQRLFSIESTVEAYLKSVF
jgi:glycosyltransferase involved in cell wall biosynthesis